MHRDNFRIGWICALPHELAASRCMLDEEYPQFPDQDLTDDNVYFPGRIGNHCVVLACLPTGKYDTVSATTTASNMLQSFPSLRFGLMVGIGDAVPEPHGLRLGDIVVSRPAGSHGGVIQYHLEKIGENSGREVKFERRGHLNSPPRVLLNALQGLQASHEFGKSKISQYVSEMLDKHPSMVPGYIRPGPNKDPLYSERLDGHGSTDHGPRIFYGLIASGDWEVVSVKERERLAKDENILCFEMEAAGLMNSFQCLVIRGMSNYADGTKSDDWQKYAAATAAAYAKELLELVPATALSNPTSMTSVTQEILQRCLLWLKYPTSKPYLDDAYAKRTPSTGDWFLTNHLKTWREKDYSFLWMYGKAGCGKTVLCSTIVKQVLETAPLVAYFYFSYRRTEAQGLQHLLHALVIQLVQQSTKLDIGSSTLFRLPKGFQQLYDQYMLETEPTIEDLKIALLEILAESQPSFILIDALDECEPSDSRDSILQFFQWLHERQPHGTHILITSRSTADIEATMEELENFTGFQKLLIESTNVDSDIILYAQHYLKHFPPYKGWTEDITEMVLHELGNRSHGVFRWAECQLKELRSIETRLEILTALRELPRNLDETYERMLQKVQSSKYSAKAFAALEWLAFSKRPLTVKQLAEIAAFSIDGDPVNTSKPISLDLNNRFLQPIRFCHILGGLVVIGSQSVLDVKLDQTTASILDSEISFAHYSVLEYLSCPRVNPNWRLEAGMSHRFLFESCSIYIQHFAQTVQASQPEPDITGFPLIVYACRYWIDHFREAFQTRSETEFTKKQFQKLFLGTGQCFISSLKLAFGKSKSGQKLYYSNAVHCSPAYFLALHNLSHGIAIFPSPNEGIRLGVQDLYAGKSALHVACSNGYVDTMVALLEKDADINQTSSHGWTALHYGARAGSVDIVKNILNWASPFSENSIVGIGDAISLSDSSSLTELSTGDTSIYSKVNIFALTEDYETILHSAVRAGSAGVVELLVHSIGELNLEAKNIHGLTPLQLAVRIASWSPSPSLQVIQSLLKAGADREKTSPAGRTISQEALETANEALINLVATHNGVALKKDDYIVRDLWTPIYAALQKILWVDEADPSANTLIFIKAYTAVHDYCTISKGTPSRSSTVPSTRAHLLGEKLYLKFLDYIDLQLNEIEFSAISHDSIDKDGYYQRASCQWLQFAALASVKVFNFLERHWITREIDEGKKGIYGITMTCIKRWKDTIGNAHLPTTHRIDLRGSEDLELVEEDALSTYFEIMPSNQGLADWATVHIYTTGLIFDYYFIYVNLDPLKTEAWLLQKLGHTLRTQDEIALKRFHVLSGVLPRNREGMVGTTKFSRIIGAIRHFDWSVNMGNHKWAILEEYLRQRGLDMAI